MDLHANAALSLERRQLCRRVVVDAWTLKGAAEAAGVSERCARKWVGRYRAGATDLLDRSSAPGSSNRTAGAGRGDRGLRRLRLTAAEIAEVAWDAALDGVGILTRIGLGTLGRLGLEPPSAMSEQPR